MKTILKKVNQFSGILNFNFSGKYTASYLVSIIILCAASFSAIAQGESPQKDMRADRDLRGSSRINPLTLAMEMSVPLGIYPGRAGNDFPITFNYSSKVWSERVIEHDPDTGIHSPWYFPLFSENKSAGWSNSLGTVFIKSGDGSIAPDPTLPNYRYYVKRIYATFQDGSTHEFRADDEVNSGDPTAPSGTYLAVDGSRAKMVFGETIHTLFMPDGSRYLFDTLPYSTTEPGTPAKIFIDAFGNKMTFDTTTNQWSDTRGATIATLQGAISSGQQTLQLPKLDGQNAREAKFIWKQLKNFQTGETVLYNPNDVLAADGSRVCRTGTTPTIEAPYLFQTWCVKNWGETTPDYRFNPKLLSEIELPNGSKYIFKYNTYGEISYIQYPTGGYERFNYATIPSLEYESVQINRGVVDRWASAGNGAAEYHWHYSANVGSDGYSITTTNPDGTSEKRYVYQYPNSDGPLGFHHSLSGMEYDQRSYNSSGEMMSRRLTEWLFTGSYATPSNSATRDQRIGREIAIIREPGAQYALATMTENIYDTTGNTNLEYFSSTLVKRSKKYGFVLISESDSRNLDYQTLFNYLSGQFAAQQPLVISESDYIYDDNYRQRNIVGLVSEQRIIKPSNNEIVSKTQFWYDESQYSLSSVGNLPTAAANSWLNPQSELGTTLGSKRGVATTVRKYSNISNNQFIEAHSFYDQYGSTRKVRDGRGNDTETEYSAASAFAFPSKVTTPIPDPNATQNSDGLLHGSDTAFTTTLTFDYATGLPLTTTDPNGLETRIEYDPVSLRARFSRTFYNGGQVGGISETVYHDEPSNYWVKSRTQIGTDQWGENISYLDGLGRAYKSEQIDSQGNKFVEKEFDENGRVKRVTNPFRPNETKYWTTNVYDESSRIKEVILPDGAKVKNSYGVSVTGITGITKQITDQAGKKRKGISDALGRMVRVIEDPDGQNLNTDYVFDILGNLRKTTQGEQNRYFTYDSLGRLLYAKQPEQEANTNFNHTDSITSNSNWSVKYEYDDNGNITTTTDARNVSVTGIYDNLNRLKFRDYSDATPDASFFYDGTGLPSVPAFSKSKTTKVTSSVSETRYTSFDVFGRSLTSEQRTPFDNTETIANAVPRVSSYNYDSFGKLLSETYPSGRTVKMDYDQDGDVSSVWGTVNGQNRLYANGITTNAVGATTRMRLGNGKWETAVYNERLQITEIGLGSSISDKSLMKLEFGYGGATQNNSSMRSQKISFNGLAQAFEQNYVYDDLNRLYSAEEKVNNATTWKQTFTYDRYGNRRFNAAETTTITQSNKVTNPDINTSDNRLKKDQDNDSFADYDYDKNGNLVLDAENKHFIYDAENHLKEFVTGTNNTEVPDGIYQYDGGGRRVKKISSTEITIFVYNGGGQLVAEYSTALSQTPQISYLTNDHLGSPRVVTDSAGKIIARHDYSAFGDETFTSQRTTALGYQADKIRQDYTGYQKDEESGLEYAQARYYNAQHGRFTSVDPLTASAAIKNPQTFNRYSYVLNSPYKFTDPLGLKSSPPQGERGRNRDLDDFMSRNMVRDSSDYKTPFEVGSPIIAQTGGHGNTSHAASPPMNEQNADAEGTTTLTEYTIILAYGESGDGEHNTGSNFERAARTRAAELEAAGFHIIYAPISTIEGFQGILNVASNTYHPTLGIEFFGHGSWDRIYIGDVTSNVNKITMENVKQLKNSSEFLSYITLNACFTGAQTNGIAAALAKQLGVSVTAATSGTIFSSKPDRITSRGIHPSTGPTYMLPDGGKWVTFKP